MKDIADFSKRVERFFSDIQKNSEIFYILHPKTGILMSESHKYVDSLNIPYPVVPVWSEHYLPYARKYAQDLEIETIKLEEFRDQMLPYMIQSNVIVGINWNHLGYGIEMEPEEVLSQITQK